MKESDIFRDIAVLEKENFSDSWSESLLHDTFEYEYNHLLFEQAGNKIIGYIIYTDIQGEVELQRIAVDKSYRRRGIAGQLIDRMIVDLYDNGENLERIILEVRSRNVAAIKLYKSKGFEQTFIRKDYYQNPDDDALIMQKNMTQVTV